MPPWRRSLFAALIAVAALMSGSLATASDDGVPWATGWGSFRVAKSSTFTPTAADRGTVYDCSATLTVNLPSAATVGSGYHLTVYNSGAGTVTVSVGSGTIRTPTGTGATTTLTQGQGLVFECDGTNYLAVAGGGGTPVGTASGDLSGTYPGPTVAKINGVSVGTATATSGNVLIGSGSAWVTHALSGDATIGSTGVVALKNTGTAGTYASVTTDAQGRVTAGAALSGDVTTSGAAATLANTAVAAGSYTSANITVDSKGRLTAASSGGGGFSALAVGVDTAQVFNTITPGTLLSAPKSGTLTIPANYFTVGRAIEIQVRGHLNCASTPTLAFRIIADATTTFSSTTIGSSNAPIYLDVIVVCTATGGGGTVKISGTAAVNGLTLGDLTPTSASYDTTASHVLDIQGSWSVASASSFVTGYWYTVLPLN